LKLNVYHCFLKLWFIIHFNPWFVGYPKGCAQGGAQGGVQGAQGFAQGPEQAPCAHPAQEPCAPAQLEHLPVHTLCKEVNVCTTIK